MDSNSRFLADGRTMCDVGDSQAFSRALGREQSGAGQGRAGWDSVGHARKDARKIVRLIYDTRVETRA